MSAPRRRRCARRGVAAKSEECCREVGFQNNSPRSFRSRHFSHRPLTQLCIAFTNMAGRDACVTARNNAAHFALPLPLACILKVFALLSPRERLLTAAVSRSWRAAASDASLWHTLDFTPSGAGGGRVVTDALLVACAAKAAGHLRSLSLRVGVYTAGARMSVSTVAACAAVAASSASLRQLELKCSPLTLALAAQLTVPKARVDAVLRLVPHLVAFDADVGCSSKQARALLTNASPYQLLRIRRLRVSGFTGGAASVLALASDVCQHEPLAELIVQRAPLHAAPPVAALVDAVVARGLTGLMLDGYGVVRVFGTSRFLPLRLSRLTCPHSGTAMRPFSRPSSVRE